MTLGSAKGMGRSGGFVVRKNAKCSGHGRHEDGAVQVLVPIRSQEVSEAKQAGVARGPVKRRALLAGWCSAHRGSPEQSRIESNAWPRCASSMPRSPNDTRPPSVPSLSGARCRSGAAISGGPYRVPRVDPLSERGRPCTRTPAIAADQGVGERVQETYLRPAKESSGGCQPPDRPPTACWAREESC